MKKSMCDLAGPHGVKDEPWRVHAASCPDCGEVLVVSEWMANLAAKTSIPRNFPAAGYLTMKARIQRKHSAVEKAEAVRGYAMVAVAGILFTVMAGGLLNGDTRFGAVMINGLSLLSLYAVELIVAVVIVAVVSVGTAYLDRETKM